MSVVWRLQIHGAAMATTELTTDLTQTFLERVKVTARPMWHLQHMKECRLTFFMEGAQGGCVMVCHGVSGWVVTGRAPECAWPGWS